MRYFEPHAGSASIGSEAPLILQGFSMQATSCADACLVLTMGLFASGYLQGMPRLVVLSKKKSRIPVRPYFELYSDPSLQLAWRKLTHS